MNGDQTAQLIYLALLGSVIAFWFFISNRGRLNQTFQQAAVWGLIFVGVIAGYGLWQDIRQDVLLTHSIDAEGGEISVPRSPDGHYYLSLEVNDTTVRFVVDTGATEMVLTNEDAER
ncbi:MAG: aspartyl protease family protein, partial [Arenibacterium sp.]